MINVVKETEMSVESNFQYAGFLFQEDQGNVMMSGRLSSFRSEKGDDGF